jgi:hypothetical protein
MLGRQFHKVRPLRDENRMGQDQECLRLPGGYARESGVKLIRLPHLDRYELQSEGPARLRNFFQRGRREWIRT